MKRISAITFILIMGLASLLMAQSAMKPLHGDFDYMKVGLHAGNQIRTTFFNDGTYGTNNSHQKGQGGIGGEWPINSGHPYLLDGNVWVGSEVIDINGELKHITSTVTSAGSPTVGAPGGQWSTGDSDLRTGEWWTFLPLPGFAKHPGDSIAMSKWPAAWPESWPDKSDDAVDPGWKSQWNGYFGKGQLNADEEAFFVTDDYNKKEFEFYPDSLDHSRKGLGMRMSVRSFQWANVLVQNALFMLFDIENIGTYNHDKMAFGYKIGNNVGETNTQGGEDSDDNGAFNLAEDLAYMWDAVGAGGVSVGAGGWSPVGWIGGAFLESPGNPVDGIDNDGDGINGSGPVISESMFDSKILNAGDQIVVINYTTFVREVTTMPNDTLRIAYQDQIFKFWPGMLISETRNNLVDDNLNGVIDENNGTTTGLAPNEVNRYLYVGLKYINFFTGEGRDNPLIDERRDDGRDNDGDWSAVMDDLGQDGAPFTKDPGEKDGRPTFGEPHFEKTDIHETDMLGLTSFNLYAWTSFAHSDDEAVWAKLRPGKLDAEMNNANIELFWGSGYFPMQPQDIQRFSMGLVLGYSFDELLTNKRWMTKAYAENYNFSRAPNIPTLSAVSGDNKVTLYWDSFAEESNDPITGKDFEGYRIYRSTDAGWNDMTMVTDGQGSFAYRKPLAQFDLNNGLRGYSAIAQKGVQFYLGDDTGLQHTWVDSTAKNGFKYFYAITSYDHGDPPNLIPPSECSKFISLGTVGEVLEKGSNVVVVRPEAPSAGYVSSRNDEIHLVPGSTTSGTMTLALVDPAKVKDGHIYHVTFKDTLAVYPNVPDTLKTQSVSLIDVTDLGSPVTLVSDWKMLGLEDKLPITDGFELSLRNEAQLLLDTSRTKWNNAGIFAQSVAQYAYAKEVESPMSRDMNIIFSDSAAVLDSSTACIRRAKVLPPVGVNFTVLDAVTGQKVPFGFWVNEGNDGQFSRSRTKTDEILILNPSPDDTLRASLVIKLNASTDDSVRRKPGVGDTLAIRMFKPFLSHDVFEFTMRGASMDSAVARASLSSIKVVPNPYIVANSWEPTNPYSDGRGERQLHFIHLPPVCTIRVFNVRGQLVATINHNTPNLSDGTEIWDMLSKDQLDISYGIYVYHVDAGSLGTKVGKFAVIK